MSGASRWGAAPALASGSGGPERDAAAACVTAAPENPASVRRRRQVSVEERRTAGVSTQSAATLDLARCLLARPRRCALLRRRTCRSPPRDTTDSGARPSGRSRRVRRLLPLSREPRRRVAVPPKRAPLRQRTDRSHRWMRPRLRGRQIHLRTERGCLFGGKRVFLSALPAPSSPTSFSASRRDSWSSSLWASIGSCNRPDGWASSSSSAAGTSGRYGVVMAWLSLSFLLGDVAARGFSAGLLAFGLGWRALFFAPAASARSSGSSRPHSSTAGDIAAMKRSRSPRDLQPPRAVRDSSHGNQGFWMTCLSSFLLTFLRTVFLDWTVLYLVDREPSRGRRRSSRCSSRLDRRRSGPLLPGWYSRPVSRSRRGPVAARCSASSRLASSPSRSSARARRGARWCSSASPASSWSVRTPSSPGAMALDSAARRASGTAAGIIDGVGYLGGAASGLGIGGIVEDPRLDLRVLRPRGRQRPGVPGRAPLLADLRASRARRLTLCQSDRQPLSAAASFVSARRNPIEVRRASIRVPRRSRRGAGARWRTTCVRPWCRR